MTASPSSSRCHDLDDLGELREAHARSLERDARGLVLALVPARAEADGRAGRRSPRRGWPAPWRAPSADAAARKHERARAARATSHARARPARRSGRSRRARRAVRRTSRCSRKRWSASQTESKPERLGSRRPSAAPCPSAAAARPAPRSRTAAEPGRSSMACASVGPVLECVINVSEGRATRSSTRSRPPPAPCLLDVHTDPHHHRSVLTLAGPDVEAAARALAPMAVSVVDLRLAPRRAPAARARSTWCPSCPSADRRSATHVAAQVTLRGAGWATALGVPCFLYGPARLAARGAAPRVPHAVARTPGRVRPHPTAGATCVGARPVLVAYNVWLARGHRARPSPGAIAPSGARPGGAGARPSASATALQVSMNLVDPADGRPGAGLRRGGRAHARRSTRRRAGRAGARGRARPPCRRHGGRELDLDPGRTIEAPARGGSG